LQTYVKNLRRILEPDRASGVASDVLMTRRPGYVLRVDADGLDSWRGDRLIAEGRRDLDDGDVVRAGMQLRQALSLWKGPAFGELAGETYLQVEAVRLEELRLVATEERIDVMLGVGRHHEIVPDLERLPAAHPYRERFTAQLMTALHRSGREVDAHRAFAQFRAVLGEETGLEPAPTSATRRAICRRRRGHGDSASYGLRRRRAAGRRCLCCGVPGDAAGLGREVALKQICAGWPTTIVRAPVRGRGPARVARASTSCLYDYWRAGRRYLNVPVVARRQCGGVALTQRPMAT
jgi:DNA-binding SARP family transcriptional activator